MSMAEWLVRFVIISILVMASTLYLRGWHRLRLAGSPLARASRLVFFASSLLLILVATLPPLYPLSHQFLFARALQKILMAMVAAPFLWLSCPVHISLRGLSFPWRQRVFRTLQPHTWSGQLLRTMTYPGTTWLIYVAAIVIWHDAAVVNWTMQGQTRHYLTLFVMFGAALLYWVHIIGTGFQLRWSLPGWMLFAYAVGVEIPNMTAGIAIAYSGRPLYSHYVVTHEGLAFSILDDQMISGGLVWFMGSVVFFFSAVLIVNRLFIRNKG